MDRTAGANRSVADARAACYPLYPIIARRGVLPAGGVLFDMHSWCFRHEPSPDPARMQCFRVREFVRMGSNEQVLEFRQAWLDRAQGFVTELALPYTIDIAHDPFFGRAGRLMADSQREQRLKYELLIPVANDEKPTACMSFNYHLDHFGEPWGIHQADGKVAISGCVGFGLGAHRAGVVPPSWAGPGAVAGEDACGAAVGRMNDAVDLRAPAAPARECDWPITNCYVDAWMLVLRAWGLDPLAGLGVTVAQDYEGDQFTFFKYLHEDLETPVRRGRRRAVHLACSGRADRRAGAAWPLGAGGGGWLLPAGHARHVLSHAAYQDDDRASIRWISPRAG